MDSSACRETPVSLQAFFFLTARSESPFPFRGRAPELPRKTHARRSRTTRSSAGVEGAPLLGSSLKSKKTLLHPAHPCWMEDNLFHIPAGSRHQRLFFPFLFSTQAAIAQPMPFF